MRQAGCPIEGDVTLLTPACLTNMSPSVRVCVCSCLQALLLPQPSQGQRLVAVRLHAVSRRRPCCRRLLLRGRVLI